MARKKKGQNIEKILTKAPTRYQKIDPLDISLDEFEQLLPKTIPKIIREDIVQYFNYLRNSRSKESLQLWEKTSHCTDSPNSWKTDGYRPIFAFLYYDRITDGLFLRLLLDRIEPISKQEDKEMTIEEFNRQCRLTISAFQPKIDIIDFKILQALSENPSLVIEELSEKIGHSYAAVYRHYQKLKRKLGLRTLTRINYGKLGIQPFFFVTQDKELFDYFEEFKMFLDGQATFLWGKKHYLRFYLVNVSMHERLLQRFEELLQEKENVSIELYKQTSPSLIRWFFDSYDHQEHRWKLDFIRTFRYLKDNQKEQMQVKELFTDNYIPETIYQLTPLEKNIIDDLVGKYNLTQKELADHLGMHAQNLSTIKLKLLADRIIYPRFEIRNFLPLGCLLWCSSSKEQSFKTLIPLLEKLPYSNISPVENHRVSENSEIICFLYLDDILYHNLVSFLSKLLDNNQIDDFQIGLNIESYFGMSTVKRILEKNDID